MDNTHLISNFIYITNCPTKADELHWILSPQACPSSESLKVMPRKISMSVVRIWAETTDKIDAPLLDAGDSNGTGLEENTTDIPRDAMHSKPCTANSGGASPNSASVNKQKRTRTQTLNEAKACGCTIRFFSSMPKRTQSKESNFNEFKSQLRQPDPSPVPHPAW